MMIIIIIFIKDTGYVYNYILGLLVVVGVLYVRVCVSVCHSVFYSRPNLDRKSTRLNSSHVLRSRMPSSA